MTFRTALSGLNAAAADLSVTANNIANANTTGFKESRAMFADVVAANGLTLFREDIGGGARLADVQQQFRQGNLEFTDNGLDLALSGDGFFTLSNQGAISYTRNGAFSLDRDGYMVNAQGLRLQGFAPIAGGGFNTGGLQDIQLLSSDSAPRASSKVELLLNLPANAAVPATAAFDPGDASSFNQSTAVSVFDSLGAAHTLSTYYVKTANPGEWQVHAAFDGTSLPAAVGTLNFDAGGSLTSPVDGQLALPAIPAGNGAEDLSIGLDLAKLTQFGDYFSVNSLLQDGFAAGRLVDVEVNAEGIIQARFSNGQTTPVSQLALTRFTNPEGLKLEGETSWIETFDSGLAQRGAAGSGGMGVIQGSALESSNVDLTAQLVQMITAQRNFQANAQMITTQDQVTQAALNIR